MDSQPNGAHQALIEFLYQAPIGLLQATPDGEITMINPMSASLLMPLVTDGNLLNLFDVLDGVAPELRQLASCVDPSGGVICDGLRIDLPAHGPPAALAVRTLSLRIVKLGGTLVASVADASLAVQREQQQLISTLKDASRLDALTGLPNRSVAIERIAAALAVSCTDAGGHFAVILLNCDRFDRVNVTLGSAVGDELLRMIGARLNGTIRLDDGLCGQRPGEPAAARLDSDEFVLVVQNVRESDAVPGIALRVVDALAQPFAINGQAVHITASVGVVLGRDAVGGPDEILQSAHIAMLEVKRAGGARYGFFDPSMRERAARLGSMESALRTAISEGQLFVVYQPIVGLVSGDCDGVEALVRWRHPSRGIVPPIEFIEIAEETGLIGALGDFVLNESCRQMVRWQHELGAATPNLLSVNLSKAQLRDGGFVSQVRRALANSGLAADRLQLEVTESLAAQDAHVREQLHELKALGLSLALDDFGTGYSSLSSLHQLPVDVVKIDRSFVSQLDSSAHHRVLVEATVRVARSLGMKTVAEGIETEGQAAELKRLRCDKGQGYLFAKPLSAGDASDWLRRRVQVSSLAA